MLPKTKAVALSLKLYGIYGFRKGTSIRDHLEVTFTINCVSLQFAISFNEAVEGR